MPLQFINLDIIKKPKFRPSRFDATCRLKSSERKRAIHIELKKTKDNNKQKLIKHNKAAIEENNTYNKKNTKYFS